MTRGRTWYIVRPDCGARPPGRARCFLDFSIDDLNLELLATGCRYSGTGYISHLISSAGMPCGHELVFRVPPLGVRSMFQPEDMPVGLGSWWNLRAESSWPAIDHLDHPCCAQARIVHVVRDPLRVLRSMIYTAAANWRVSLEAACKDWISANTQLLEVARRKETIICPVELRTGILDLLDLRPPPGTVVFDNPTYNRHYLGDPDDEVTKDMVADLGLLGLRVLELAKLFGYYY